MTKRKRRAGAPDTEPDLSVAEGAQGAEAEAPADAADDDALQAALKKADDNWNNYLRAAADLENLRRRAQRDVEHAHKFGLERFARELLKVRDSMELGLSAASEDSADVTTLREGMELTLRHLAQVMREFGIHEVEPEGEPFDPELHEAMAMRPSDTAEPSSVLEVVQKGYQLNERLLRPARVVVAGPPADD